MLCSVEFHESDQTGILPQCKFVHRPSLLCNMPGVQRCIACMYAEELNMPSNLGGNAAAESAGMARTKPRMTFATVGGTLLSGLLP